jgi:hypothetical protein
VFIGGGKPGGRLGTVLVATAAAAAAAAARMFAGLQLAAGAGRRHFARTLLGRQFASSDYLAASCFICTRIFLFLIVSVGARRGGRRVIVGSIGGIRQAPFAQYAQFSSGQIALRRSSEQNACAKNKQNRRTKTNDE